jgi:hypothetical protein
MRFCASVETRVRADHRCPLMAVSVPYEGAPSGTSSGGAYGTGEVRQPEAVRVLGGAPVEEPQTGQPSGCKDVIFSVRAQVAWTENVCPRLPALNLSEPPVDGRLASSASALCAVCGVRGSGKARLPELGRSARRHPPLLQRSESARRVSRTTGCDPSRERRSRPAAAVAAL